MSKSTRAMPEKITVEMRAEELPESITARMKERPIPGMPYRVTVEAVDDREAKLAALRRDIDEGIADLEAGRSQEFDVEEFLAEMHRRHGDGNR